MQKNIYNKNTAKKMKIILLLIIILTFLAGCGSIYDLNNFILPDDIEFIRLVEELNTPKKICQYMLDNFTFKSYPYICLTPYQLYIIKKGDCNDYANFAIFIAHYHDYETYQIIMFFLNDTYRHSIAVYKEDLYSFSDNGYYFTGKYNYTTFLEIAEYDCYLRDKKYLKYVVYDYDMNIVETGYND